MGLRKIITDYSDINDDLIVYAKKIDGRFQSSSQVVLLELTEDEKDMNTTDITEQKCPGFSYFMEVFLIKEIMQDFDIKDIEGKIEAVIHYVEFDA
jgi:hypothetical protein